MKGLLYKKEYYYAVTSGICAACGSTCGKLSGNFSFDLTFDKVGYLLIKIVFISLMLMSNAGVWTFYVKALRASSTSIVPTVISTASNYVLSAIAGFILFKEQMTLLWCCGMFLVILGLALITKSNDNSEDKIKPE